MPDKRPKGFTIEYHNGGGMLDEGEEMFISEDSCRYNYHYNRAVSGTKFKISSSLLESLYKIFKDNKFDKIEMYQQQVYDRGGEDLTIYWTTYAVGNSGISFIKDKWKDEWNNVLTSFLKITMNELDKYKIDIPIYIDKSLYGKFISIQFNQDMVFNDKVTGAQDSVKIIAKELPGNYYTSIQLREPYKGWINTVDINKIKGLKFILINDELKVIEL